MDAIFTYEGTSEGTEVMVKLLADVFMHVPYTYLLLPLDEQLLLYLRLEIQIT